MQVTEIKTDGLTHEFKILVGADEIEEKMTTRLNEMAKTVHMPGFRPGKVPVHLLRKKYGSSVMGEVLELTVNERSQDTMAERGLRPAVQPKIEITSFDEGKDLEFTMEIEVLPEIEPMDFSELKLEKMVSEAADAEIDQALERLATAHKGGQPVTSKRKTKAGDIAVIDFVGSVDGEEFPGGKAEGYHLELGSGSLIPGFEDQIIGATAGSDLTVKVTFPEDYGAAELAGKAADFAVTVQEIREPTPAAIDDELAKKAGLDSLDALKKAIKEEHDKEYNALSRQRLKRNLLDELAEAYTFEVPATMIKRDFDSVWKQYEQRLEQGLEEDEKDAAKSEDEKKEEFRSLSERRVRLGLVLGEIGRVNNIEVTQEEINKAMMAEARRYPGQEQAFLDFFKKNPQDMEQVTAPLYEDKVVDFILEMATVNEKKVPVDDLMKEPEETPKKPAAKRKAAPEKKAAPKKEATAAKKPAAKKAPAKKPAAKK